MVTCFRLANAQTRTGSSKLTCGGNLERDSEDGFDDIGALESTAGEGVYVLTVVVEVAGECCVSCVCEAIEGVEGAGWGV